LNILLQPKPRPGQLVLLGLLAGLLLAAPAAARAAGSHEISVTNHITIPAHAKWNPKFWFGNLDDPVPPADYRPADHNRVHKWYFRNPTHNFTFYVIGIADKKFRRAGHHPADVFNPHGGWNYAVCKYKWARLPFVSYQRHKFSFYLGWRERGNFGLKLNW